MCEVRRQPLSLTGLQKTNARPGNLQSLNQLAADARANYIIHTGDFGFYDDRSLDRIAEKYVIFRSA
jgi:hypothetical protein